MKAMENKWVVKERKKKEADKVEPSSAPKSCHLNVSLATRSRTLRGVRK
jgi:hypothetical protein